ncbi:hypothetical protein HOP60_09730 [Halomonas daqingensis]|uniref:Uncharacterized protein n=1 Tax=Billgrantia desiderata TaxID=52021 RepID=A0ABS9B4X5_9GAMM|nr:hypothetical protein [Halomonas desiderata]MCE8042432.1 hypothetical protein [Halomonas desiderata]MCE8047007.1 hypothetical protein [Halomonas desiderata]
MTTFLLLAILVVLVIGLGVLPAIGKVISGALLPIVFVTAMAMTDNTGRVWIIAVLAALMAAGYLLIGYDKFMNSQGMKTRRNKKSLDEQLARINEKQRSR